MMPIASSGQRCSRMRSCRSLAAGVFGEHVEAHHAVGQPAPDQRRHQQHQRRDEPQRHRDDAARAAPPASQPSAPSSAATKRAAALALELREAARARPGRPCAGVISAATSSSDSTTITGTARRSGSAARSGCRAADAGRVEPAEQREHPGPAVHRRPRAARPRPPSSQVAEQGRDPADHDQRQQRQQDDARVQAVRRGAPEGVEQRASSGSWLVRGQVGVGCQIVTKSIASIGAEGRPGIACRTPVPRIAAGAPSP